MATAESAKTDKYFVTCKICDERHKSDKVLECQHSFCERCQRRLVEEHNGETVRVITCPTCQRPQEIPGSGVSAIEPNQTISNSVELFREQEVSTAPGKCQPCKKVGSTNLHEPGGISKDQAPMSTPPTPLIVGAHASRSEEPAMLQPSANRGSDRHSKVGHSSDTFDVTICPPQCIDAERTTPEARYSERAHEPAQYITNLKDGVDRMKMKESEVRLGKTYSNETRGTDLWSVSDEMEFTTPAELRVKTKSPPRENDDSVKIYAKMSTKRQPPVHGCYEQHFGLQETMVDVPRFFRVGDNVQLTVEPIEKGEDEASKMADIKATLKKPDQSEEDIKAINNDDGSWGLTARFTMAGTQTITVSVLDKSVEGSPLTVNVIPQKGLMCKFGQSGSGHGEFNGPWGVMLTKSGDVSVCDTSNNRLQNFSLRGSYRRTTSFSNISNAVSPLFTAMSEDGCLFTTDGNGCQVIVHDEDGRVMRCFGENMMKFPYGIAINAVNARVYVADFNGHCVHIYSQDGVHLKSFGRSGRSRGRLHYPLGIAFNAECKLFVSDHNNDRIQVFNSEGQYLYSFGEEGSENDHMVYPAGIAIDSYDDVYVCDWGNDRVMKYKSDGTFVCRVDCADCEESNPTGVCVTDEKPFGKVVVVYGSRCVQVFAQ